jgi:hypothetical protein
MNKKFRIKTKNMKPNQLYGGVLAGEVQMSVSGEFYWRRAGGEIQKINPHPDSLWIEVDGEPFLKTKLTLL